MQPAVVGTVASRLADNGHLCESWLRHKRTLLRAGLGTAAAVDVARQNDVGDRRPIASDRYVLHSDVLAADPG